MTEVEKATRLLRVLVFLAAFVATMLVALGITIENVEDEGRRQREVLCRIEAALTERRASTPKPEECK